jgi:ATPase subunit of ABC transporter with duplicated ATPase domains
VHRYVAAKERNTAMQMSKYDKQQKEMQRQRELIQRLSGGAQSGRAATAEKMLEKLQAEAIQKPFVAKSRNFRFPRVEKIGQKVLNLQGLTHGYNGRILFRVCPPPLTSP